MELPAFLKFASDATLLALWAGAFALLALWAMFADHRRARRRDIDRVGCMPWTVVFLLAAMRAAGLGSMALKGWLAG